MIFLSIGLIVLATVLFLVEMFIPGFGVFGISGIICLFAGLALTVIYAPYGFLAALAEIIVLLCLAYTAVRYMRRRKGLAAIILRDELGESGVSAASVTLVDQSGVTVTPLKPFGVIEIGGKRIEATSEGEMIGAGKSVIVSVVREGKVIVKLS